MTATLSAQEKQIAKIFSNDYVFNIPSYQRPYAWDVEQASELFDDIWSFIQGKEGEVAVMSPYFLGSIVLIKQENIPTCDVVDGQQRLTTLTLLISALRAHVSNDHAETLTSLIYQKGQPLLGTEDRFRLHLRERDLAFFQTHVQKPSGFEKLITIETELSDSQRRLRDNGRYFQQRIMALSELDKTKLAEFLLRRCFLVVVSTPDLDSAYRIFSVMNSRGLDLSATDILKAEIIGAIGEHERATYTKRWEDAEEEIGRGAFGELFSHIRMIYRKAKPQGTLLKEFQEHVCKTNDAPVLIGEIILPLSKIYAQLLHADYKSSSLAEEVNRNLNWLNRIEFFDWFPPALVFANAYCNEPAQMSVFFADLERLCYAMMIRKTGINERIERFSKLTAEIEGCVKSKTPWDRQSSAIQLSEFERADVIYRINGPIYETLSARSRSSLLLRLDELLSDGGATYDHKIISVEHVLPQTPAASSEWLSWFPDDDERAAWVHRIGNLALLTRNKNSSAQNYEFAKKKQTYFSKDYSTPFPLTTQVLQHEIWTPEILNARQEKLVGLLKAHWRL